MKMTEQECREFQVPYFKTKQELIDFIDGLDDLNNDYGTAAYAMSLAGVAAFNYIASRFGCTGFQSSCADMDMIRRTRCFKGPFMILDVANHMYPQYDIPERVQEYIYESRNWFIEQAKERLAEQNHHTHPDVLAHWKKLAAMEPLNNDTTVGD